MAMAEGPPDPVASIMAPMMPVVFENVRMLYESGIPILAGTDLGGPFVVPGVSLHDELRTLVDSVGLSPIDALRAATINPARAFEMSDSLGTVSDGMLADLVLLSSNPLEDIRNTTQISGVVLQGQHLSRVHLDSLLAVPALGPRP
jgi:imidazolonepropionase-like amidohydrolase